VRVGRGAGSGWGRGRVEIGEVGQEMVQGGGERGDRIGRVVRAKKRGGEEKWGK